MAEPATDTTSSAGTSTSSPTTSDPTAADQTTPERPRGRTTIADRAMERLARRFALEVPGVEEESLGPEALSALAASLPQVSVESAGDRVRLDLRIAVAWDAQARVVAGRVRSEVMRRLGESTGKTIDRVDVTVSSLVPSSAAHRHDGQRRVQ